MGNTPTTLTEQQLSQSLRQQYSIQQKPYLLQRKTGKPYTLHKIITYSHQQTQNVVDTINNYKTSRCSSISNLKTHLKRKDKSYCSDEEIFYLIFNDHGRNTLKDQYLTRRYNQQRFDNQQILAILQTMLCGTRQYYKHFQRKFENFSMQSVCIEPTSFKMYVRDPWLTVSDMSKSKANIHLSYPSLEKLKTLYVDKNYVYDEYFSELFSIGMYGLQLFHMDFVDGIYRSKTSDYDRNALGDLLNAINDPKLCNGIKVLLQDHPDRRDDIFKYWNIQCSTNHQLKYLIRTIEGRASSKNQIPFRQEQSSFPLQQPMRDTMVTFDNTHGPKFFQPIRQKSVTFGNEHIHPVHLHSPQNFPTYQETNRGYIQNPPQQYYPNTTWNTTQFSNRPVANINFINVDPQHQRKISKVTTRSVEKMEYNNNPAYPSFTKPVNQQKVYFQNNTTRVHEYPASKNQTINTFYDEKKTGQSTSLNKYDPVPTNADPYRNRSHSTKQQFVSNFAQRQRSQSSNENFSNFKISLSSRQPQQYQQKTINYTRPATETMSTYSKPNPNLPIYTNQINQKPKFNNNTQKNSSSEVLYGKKQSKSLENSPQSNMLYQNFSIQKPIESSYNQNMYQYSQQNFSNKNKFSLDTKDYQENRMTLAETAGVSLVKQEPQIKPKQMSISPINQWKSQSQPIQYKANINFQEPDDYFQKPMPYFQESKNNQNYQLDNNAITSYQEEKKTKAISPNLTLDMNIKPMNIIVKDKSPKTTKQEVQNNVTPIKNVANPNKYNSTIVQVNQQTPEGSQKSVERDQQYVVEEYQSGSRYEGFKVNGMRHGRGKFYYQDGGHYQGEWKRNKMHGWGKLYYEGGRLAYEGHWKADQFHGSGKVYNDNPIPLSYQFDYTNFDLLDDYWIYYEGTLVSDTKQGRGKIKLTNGEYFEGDFHADRIQGFGKYYTMDGNFIEGIWRDSKLIKVLNSS